MSSRLKSVAGLTAVATVLAVAGPAASANAATPTRLSVDPTVCQLLTVTTGPLGPTHLAGGAGLADVLARVAASAGCQPAAPAPSLFGPWGR
jgi:hypothetical protein